MQYRHPLLFEDRYAVARLERELERLPLEPVVAASEAAFADQLVLSM